MITCEAEGDPRPQISWYYRSVDDGDVKSETAFDTSGEVVILREELLSDPHSPIVRSTVIFQTVQQSFNISCQALSAETDYMDMADTNVDVVVMGPGDAPHMTTTVNEADIDVVLKMPKITNGRFIVRETLFENRFRATQSTMRTRKRMNCNGRR